MGGNCEEEAFGQGNPWYTRRVGFIVSGIFVLITLLVTCINVSRHARNYRAPKEQRQMIRILYMPLVYGGIGWLAYRFIHLYVYLSLIYVVYEVFALAAFLYLMIQYVSNATASTSMEVALAKKEKIRLPVPWCCFRYRPTKASFIHMVKWLVFQFIIIRPIVTIISIILYAMGELCPSDTSAANANLWLTIIDVFSMLTAMWGLLLFYKVTKQELKGHRPLLKFAIIKGIIFLTITQELVFRGLNSSGAIKPTATWTSTEVTDGLYTFLLTIEMAVASIAMLWAYSSLEYSDPGKPRGTAVRALIDSVNFSDFISDMWHSLTFFWHRERNGSHKETEEPLMLQGYNEPRVRKASGNRASSLNVDAGLTSKSEVRINVEPA